MKCLHLGFAMKRYQLCYLTCFAQSAELHPLFPAMWSLFWGISVELSLLDKKGILVPLNPIPTGRPAPLENAAIETHTVKCY